MKMDKIKQLDRYIFELTSGRIVDIRTRLPYTIMLVLGALSCILLGLLVAA